MGSREPVVPAVVRHKAAELGEPGERWLSELPHLMVALERRWAVRFGQEVDAGTSAYVARATTRTGVPVVVKIALPESHVHQQMCTLAAAHGQGYVRLLDLDLDRGAMLLEALGPSLDRRGASPEAQIATLCAMLRQAWELPAEASGATAKNKAGELEALVTRLWEDLAHPVPERVVARAVEYAARRADAFDPDHSVVVHGDAAPPNALQVLSPREGAETGFVFVDPDGFLGDPTYDLGVALRDWYPQLRGADAPSLLRRYCRLLAGYSGLDEAAIWEWGFLERVATGLYTLALGDREMAEPFRVTVTALDEDPL